MLQTTSSLSRLQPGIPPHTSHPTLFLPPSHYLLSTTPSPLVTNIINLSHCKHSTPLHFSPLIPPKNLALPHQDTLVTPVNSKPVFQSLNVLKSPTERDLTCIPSISVIDLEQEHTSNPSSRVPTLTKTAHAPLLPTTSFPECGHPNRLPSAVQGSLRSGPLPTVEAAAPPTTTSKLCLFPPVLARVGYIFTRARLCPPSPVPPARQHPRQSVRPCRSDARPSPGPRGRPPPAPRPRKHLRPGPPKPALTTNRSAPPWCCLSRGSAARSAGGRGRGRGPGGSLARRTGTRAPTGLRRAPLPGPRRGPGSALGLVSRGGGGGSAAAPNPTWRRRRRRGEQGPGASERQLGPALNARRAAGVPRSGGGGGGRGTWPAAAATAEGGARR